MGDTILMKHAASWSYTDGRRYIRDGRMAWQQTGEPNSLHFSLINIGTHKALGVPTKDPFIIISTVNVLKDGSYNSYEDRKYSYEL